MEKRLEVIKNALKTEEINFAETKVFKNGVEEIALIVGDGPCKLTIYKDSFPDTATIEQITETICSALENVPKIEDVKMWTSWDYVRDNVRLTLRPRSAIDDVVYTKRIINEKLEVIYRIFIPEGTIPVPHNLLKMWEISENELYLAALMNVNNMTLSMPMGSMFVFEGEESPDMGIPMIVFSNTELKFGGASIFNTKMLEELSQEYEDDLYIIPSSIHECIITPAKEIDYNTLQSMIIDVNESQLKPEDILADYPFYYERGSNKVNFEPKSA